MVSYVQSEQNQLTIPNQCEFTRSFNNDWKDSRNSFSDPFIRCQSCFTVITVLIWNNDFTTAKMLYDECNKKHAWNPRIGILQPSEKLERECAKFALQAFKAIFVKE